MKQKFCRSLTAVLSFCLMLNIMAVAGYAATNASDYYSSTSVYASAPGGGDVLIEYDVNATDFMDEVGVKKITIWEQQSDGSYSIVYTFTRYNTSGLIVYNAISHCGGVTYHGTSGVKYFATVQFYAKDENGNESLHFDTRVVTA